MRNPSLIPDSVFYVLLSSRPAGDWHANILTDTLIYAAWLATGRRHTTRAAAIEAIAAHQQQMATETVQ